MADISENEGRFSFEEAVSILTKKINERHETWHKRQKFYSRTSGIVVAIAIVLSAGVTIAGIRDEGIVAAILGVVLTVTLAIQQAWPLSEKNFFYRVGRAEAYALLTSLERRFLNQSSLDDIRAKFIALNTKMETEVPRGTAVHDVVQNMREEVKAAKASPSVNS